MCMQTTKRKLYLYKNMNVYDMFCRIYDTKLNVASREIQRKVAHVYINIFYNDLEFL